MYLSTSKHACIKLCRQILNKDNTYLVTIDDFHQVKTILQNFVDSGMSPKEIKEHLHLKYSDFGMFMKTSFGIKLKSSKDGVINYNKKIGKLITDEKVVYYKQCQFNFDPYRYDFIPGYPLLMDYGIYHPINNPNGVCRDHMLSKAFGWSNQIDPIIISHPANCQFLLNNDNIKKNSDSWISFEDLQERISQWDSRRLSELNFKKIATEKSIEHRKKLSEANKKVFEKRRVGLLPKNAGRKPAIPYEILITTVEQLGFDEAARKFSVSKSIIKDRFRRAMHSARKNSC